MVMSRDQILQMILQKTGKSKEQLEQELKQVYAEIKDMKLAEDPTENEKLLKEMATNRVISSYRKQLASKATPQEGVFIGFTRPIDMVAKRRREAKKLFDEKPQEAIERGITDEHGNPLVYMSEEKLASAPDWMKKRIGKKLPEKDFQKVGRGSVKTDNGYVPFTMRIRGENIKVPIPRFSMIKFAANKSSNSTPELVRLTDAGQFNFDIIKELSDKEVESLLTTTFADKIIKIKDFEKFCDENKDFDRFAIIKATITEILPNLTSDGSQMVTIEDETMEWTADEEGNVTRPILCFVPDDMNIDFPEQGITWIIGQPNIGEQGKSMSVYGFHTSEVFRNLVPKTKSIEPTSSDGW